MNYYEHHINDYAEATAHLTPLEDGVYGRLLRKYYSTEQPLPADKKKLARWVGAVGNKDALAALDVVLEEFFVLRDGCYHNSRCDEDIAKFQEGEPERELKKANEKNRLENHRAERAKLFKALTDAGGHAAWNIGIAELRALVRSVAGVAGSDAATRKGIDLKGPATPPETAPATPATATQTPDTRHQTPNNQHALVEHQQLGGLSGGPDGPVCVEVSEKAAQAMRAAGAADASGGHPRLRALVWAGLTVGELEDAARAAVRQGVDHPFPWALSRAEALRREAGKVSELPDATPDVDPDSRAAIEADAVRLRVPPWQQVDEQGRTVSWLQWADKVRRARAEAVAA